MMRKGYGRLPAALVVAGSLHAAVLLSINGPTVVKNGEPSLLQVDLVSQQEPAPAADIRETEAPAEKRAVKKQPRMEVPQPEVAYHVAEPSSQPVRTEQTSHQAEAERSGHAATAEPQLAPPHARAFILARVSYPRLARKRGWEGQVNVRFEVSNRTIHGVTRLSSSGFSVLDEAAESGLRRVSAISLVDGRYWMPVEFKLK